MGNNKLVGLLYYIMLLVVLLPAGLYLIRRVPGTTKIIWILVWFSVFLCVMILYPYLSPLLKGLR